jgi:hypothetical protein
MNLNLGTEYLNYRVSRQTSPTEPNDWSRCRRQFIFLSHYFQSWSIESRVILMGLYSHNKRLGELSSPSLKPLAMRIEPSDLHSKHYPISQEPFSPTKRSSIVRFQQPVARDRVQTINWSKASQHIVLVGGCNSESTLNAMPLFLGML